VKIRTLYVPHPEHVATSNAWAFLHWLRATGRGDLDGWEDLIAWSAADPAGFSDALAGFAGLAAGPAPLLASEEVPALVLRRADGSRTNALDLPEVAALLRRVWPRARLIRPAAEVLLHSDLRPDDRVLVAVGPPWPWLLALRHRTRLVLAPPPAPPALLAMAAEEEATILVADARTLPDAAFQRAGPRPDLSRLRGIIAVGGPLAPEARARIYTWLKPDVMLLARAGDRLWGSALDPVPVRPGLPLSFFRPLPRGPAPA
jgi:hypothetical protein